MGLVLGVLWKKVGLEGENLNWEMDFVYICMVYIIILWKKVVLVGVNNEFVQYCRSLLL